MTYHRSKLRVTKCPWLCFASVASCMVCDGAGAALHRSGQGRTGWDVSQDQDLSTHRSLTQAQCAHTQSHPQARREPAARLLPNLFLQGQRAPPRHLTSPLGNASGWAEPLYLFTGYLEHLLNPNCIREEHSMLNHDQPDSRQNLKHTPTLSSLCQVILRNLSGQVPQSKHHPHHKDSIVSSFQGYSTPTASITFSYHYQH